MLTRQNTAICVVCESSMLTAYNDLINSLPPAFHNASDIARTLTHSFDVALFLLSSVAIVVFVV